MSFDDFLHSLASLPRPLRVLEVGTRRWPQERVTSRRETVLAACPHAEHVGVDVLEGEGVDVVCDAHNLHERFPAGHFGAAVCCSTLEHLVRPWVFAWSLARVCRPGAPLWVSTHQSYPEHHYPQDYWRFSTEGLRTVFCPEVGWRVSWAGYSGPARILPLDNSVQRVGWNFEAPAYLVVDCHAVREGEVP